MFPSLRNMRYIMSNKVSATMCPRLPVPLNSSPSWTCSFDWASASPHCSRAAEIFHFRLIRIHSNARNSIFRDSHFASAKYHFYEAVDFITLPGQFRLSEKRISNPDILPVKSRTSYQEKIVFYEFRLRAPDDSCYFTLR